jgi:hypothetical protein
MKKKLFYATLLLFVKLNIYCQSPDWQVNESQFQYTMTIVAFLNVDGATLSDTNDKVAAFVDGELRGATNLIYAASNNRYLAYLVIFSNNSNETVNFKIYNSLTDKIIDVPKTLSFVINKHQGNVLQAYSLASPELSVESKIIDFNFEETTVNKVINNNKIIIESNVFITDNINTLNARFDLSPGSKLYESTNQIISGNNSLDFSDSKKVNVLSEDESVFEEWTIEIINVDRDGDGVYSDTDCDDNEPLAYPGNTEVSNDGIDNDCDPNTLDNSSLNLNIQEKKYFRIFPNPANGFIQLESIEVYTEKFNCKIFDVNGREIKRIENIDKDFKIDISIFKKGVYIIQVYNNTNKQTKRFIKI